MNENDTNRRNHFCSGHYGHLGGARFCEPRPTPLKLFSITAPSGANSAITGIAGTSALISLKAGAHTFAATAQMADGTESSPNASTATATVAPGTPASFSVVVQ